MKRLAILLLAMALIISCTIKIEPIKDSTTASINTSNNIFECNDLTVHIPPDFDFRDSYVERRDANNNIDSSKDIRIYEYYFYAKANKDKEVSEGILILTQRFQDPKAYYYYGNSSDPFRNTEALEKGAFKINGKKVWYRYHKFTSLDKFTMKMLQKHGLKLKEKNTAGLQYTVVRITRYKFLAVMYIKGISGNPYGALTQFKQEISSTMIIE